MSFNRPRSTFDSPLRVTFHYIIANDKARDHEIEIDNGSTASAILHQLQLKHPDVMFGDFVETGEQINSNQKTLSDHYRVEFLIIENVLVTNMLNLIISMNKYSD
jgi:hypothetical protein